MAGVPRKKSKIKPGVRHQEEDDENIILDVISNSIRASSYSGTSPAAKTSLEGFKNDWLKLSQEQVFEKCRRLYEIDGGFVETVVNLQRAFYNDKPRFIYASESDRLRMRGYEAGLKTLLRDIWLEYLICDNIVTQWMAPESSETPFFMVLDCENVKYNNIFGVESLQVKVPKVILTAAQKKELSDKWIKAYERGGYVTLDPDAGECFHVGTARKKYKGLSMPSLRPIFEDMGILENMKVSDWIAGYRSQEIIRQVKKGHKIDGGPLAGEPIHFIKKSQADKITKSLKEKTGSFDIVTNFDVDINYVTFDQKFFNKDKYEATNRRLREWAGPLFMIFEKPEYTESMMEAMRPIADFHRDIISQYFEEIINHDQAFKKVGVIKKPVRVEFNPYTFMSVKQFNEVLTRNLANGLMSPQTVRRFADIDSDEESGLMKEAHKDKKAFTPVFEAKQGMAGDGDAASAGVPGGKKNGRPES